jgi:hypothetical protein
MTANAYHLSGPRTPRDEDEDDDIFDDDENITGDEDLYDDIENEEPADEKDVIEEQEDMEIDLPDLEDDELGEGD